MGFRIMLMERHLLHVRMLLYLEYQRTQFWKRSVVMKIIKTFLCFGSKIQTGKGIRHRNRSDWIFGVEFTSYTPDYVHIEVVLVASDRGVCKTFIVFTVFGLFTFTFKYTISKLMRHECRQLMTSRARK